MFRHPSVLRYLPTCLPFVLRSLNVPCTSCSPNSSRILDISPGVLSKQSMSIPIYLCPKSLAATAVDHYRYKGLTQHLVSVFPRLILFGRQPERNRARCGFFLPSSGTSRHIDVNFSSQDLNSLPINLSPILKLYNSLYATTQLRPKVIHRLLCHHTNQTPNPTHSKIPQHQTHCKHNQLPRGTWSTDFQHRPLHNRTD